MGYTTQFRGEVKITPELKAEQIKFLQSMEGDMRDWNPTEAERLDFTHFDWELNDNLDGLRWNGAEKFYDATEKMQYMIDRFIEKWDGFTFNGIIQAQGEEFDDRWHLIVKNNKASEKKIALTGQIVECPHCEEKFELEED